MIFLVVATLATQALARSYDFKLLKQKTISTGAQTTLQGKLVHYEYSVRIGGAGKLDSTEPLEIRAATIYKEPEAKTSIFNDITTLGGICATNKTAQTFYVRSADALRAIDKYWDGDEDKYGWTAGGIVIEVWQGGKCVKHWGGGSTSPLSKRNLTKKDAKPILSNPKFATAIDREPFNH